MTDDATQAVLQSGLQAWIAGDLDVLHTLLAPNVTLLGPEPGPLDCVGRAQVLQLLRHHEGTGHQFEAGPIEQLDEHTFVVTTNLPGDAGAIRLTVADGQVVQMHQFRTRDSAVRGDAPEEAAAIAAVRAGDVQALQRILTDHPGMATARLSSHGDRTLLHVATDWPGHYPSVAAIIKTLTESGADPDAPSVGDHSETPLHWAASSDDVEAVDALVNAGADIEARGAVIGGGTPLADATAFGQWNAARRLIEYGAQSTLWESAALGLMDRVIRNFNDNHPTAEDITASFWAACHGNQPGAAAYLLARGADINWIGWDDLTPLDAAQREGATDLLDWLREHGAKPAIDSG